MEITKGEFIPQFLGVLEMALNNSLPNKEDETVMITLGWQCIEDTTRHIQLVAGEVKDGVTYNKEGK